MVKALFVASILIDYLNGVPQALRLALYSGKGRRPCLVGNGQTIGIAGAPPALLDTRPEPMAFCACCRSGQGDVVRH